MTEKGNLSISVTDFGPIARANIDLRPLTVFVGPNNTGKSYFTILIYALHKFFADRFRHRLLYPSRHAALYAGQDWKTLKLSYEEIESIIMIANDLVDRSSVSSRLKLVEQISQESYISVQEPTAHLIRTMLKGIGIAAGILNGRIAKEFGVDNTLQLVRNQVKGGARVVITCQISRAQQYKYDFIIRHADQELSLMIADKTPLRINIADLPRYRRRQMMNILDKITHIRNSYGPYFEGNMIQYYADELLMGLSDAMTSAIVSPLDSEAYYLPSDRTGIMHIYRTMVRSLISGAPSVGIQRDSIIPQLSGVLVGFLDGLISLDTNSTRISNKDVSTSDIATQIEKTILQGKVVLESSEVKYPELFYRPLGWKYDVLPLLNSSSMVSELAPVVLYLRHIVKPNNLLIIEEPESHLHPAMQVEFTRYLIAAVKKGVRVMLTTHSEWVLDELARLVLLSDLPESKRDGIAGKEYALRGDEVGVWLFEPKKRPKGSVVKEISFDSEYAGFRSGFDDVAIVAHNDYATIVNRMLEDSDCGSAAGQ